MGHRVTLKPSAHSFEVPEGQSILQAGLDAGFMMPYSCRTGVCRTCRGTLLEGKVDYGAVHPTYLPDSDKAKGYALLCQAKPLSDVVVEVHELAGVAGIRPRKIPCRVEKIERPAPDVAILNLRLPMNENFRFLAGQYIDFLLKDGKRRSYSIANPPRSEGVTALELHVRHTPGGAFTDQVFSTLKVRDLLRFEGPLGTFFLREESDKPI
ncbi:MAG: 2Fe-2S iron-sulfur cluster binding domain-containing protein, partial [Betaproteobacteria bacterium]